MIKKHDLFVSSKNRNSDSRLELILKRKQSDITDSDDFKNFGFDYFDNKDYGVGYGGYTYDGRYKSAVSDIIDTFSLRPPARILEIGCAKGFILYEFFKAGFDVTGVDISRYAVEHAIEEIQQYISCQSCVELNYPENHFDFIYSKEMLPHLTEHQIAQVISNINKIANKDNVFLEIQVADTEQAKQLVYAWDNTHQTVKSADWWLEKLNELGFRGTVNFKSLF